jgi:hypothetical protein
MANLVEKTLEDKLAALEAKIAILEKRHNELHQRVFTVTENSSGNANEVAQVRITKCHECNT